MPALRTALDHVGRVHHRQRSWRTWFRVAWWVLLLPVAIACWAALQERRPKMIAGWALAGLTALIWVVAATGSGKDSHPQTLATDAGTSSATASPVSTPSPATSSTPSPTTSPTPSPSATPSPTDTVVPSTPITSTVVVATTPESQPLIAPPAPKAPTAPATKASVVVPPVVAPPVGAKTYANCAAMHADWPHGVGMPGAVDHTSGTPVTTFAVQPAVYQANTGSDADGDQIACEKK